MEVLVLIAAALLALFVIPFGIIVYTARKSGHPIIVGRYTIEPPRRD